MIDLHTHSTISDGTVSPSQLPRIAAQNGLSAIALTDHDTIGGIDDFLKAGIDTPQTECIPGIELSSHIEGEPFNYHIVGLFINPQRREPLDTLCAQCIAWRNDRNEKLLDNLNRLGYKISWDDVKAIKIDGEDIVGRPHFAAALVAKGYCQTGQEAFDKLINPGRPAFAERHVPDPKTCFDVLHQAGAIAIWAHPMARKSMTNRHCESVAATLKKMGLDGIEAYYPEHTSVNTSTVLSIAKSYGLLVSGGSDFHGANQRSSLGTGYGTLNVPDTLLTPMRAALNNYR